MDDFETQRQREERLFKLSIMKWSAGAITGIVAIIALLMWGMPLYGVWQQGLAGEAELARAEQNRKITVQEAQAKLDAARLLADAEVERAKGIAKANEVIATGLGGPEGYLRWLWIDSLSNPRQGTQVIYVPTEAGLPILEASKR